MLAWRRRPQLFSSSPVKDEAQRSSLCCFEVSCAKRFSLVFNIWVKIYTQLLDYFNFCLLSFSYRQVRCQEG